MKLVSFSHCVSTAFHQQAVHSPLEQQKGPRQSGPVPCQNCGKPCKGEVLRVQNNHFHIKCFVCKGNTSVITHSILIFCYCVTIFRQLHKGFYALKGTLNVHVIEPEHKTNVMKTKVFYCAALQQTQSFSTNGEGGAYTVVLTAVYQNQSWEEVYLGDYVSSVWNLISSKIAQIKPNTWMTVVCLSVACVFACVLMYALDNFSQHRLFQLDDVVNTDSGC